MDAIRSGTDISEAWQEAITLACRRRRVLVLGATDVGKTTFIRAVLGNGAGAMRLIDLDPGQKMIGAPGTMGIGTLEQLERFIFVGTTSASALSAIARAAHELTAGTEPFIVNTAGFVRGIGARLQAMTAAAIEPDLVVEIGEAPILAGSGAEIVRVERSPFACRKSPAFRRGLRQAAFDRAREGAELLTLRVPVAPGPLAQWETAARPVCALADEKGEDLAIGIIEAAEEGGLQVRARAPNASVALVRVGQMWAEPKEGRWRLLDRLSPAWTG